MHNNLNLISNSLRKKIINTSARCNIPHLGSCLSCIDILVFLYWEELKLYSKDSTNISRDRFVLSKGHGAPALFQVLAEREFFDRKLLDEFGEPGSVFHEHPPKPGLIPGIEAATGSLGHGFPMALGMALSEKINSMNFYTYALISDGECNEGTIWEAAMLAASNKVNKLTAIIDYNKWQATGRSNEIMPLEPLDEKWRSFGWHVIEINGHDFDEMKIAFETCKSIDDKPSIIIAHTIKGKGISFMEDDNNWHYRIPNQEELNLAIKELENIS